MKILIIEDNHRIAYQVKTQFAKKYIVDIAYTGEDGIRKAVSADYSLIVLDLGLPDKDGLEVCKALRELDIVTPILILTGIDEVDSRVELLDSGADDYLAKPFNSNELAARVNALTRRREKQYLQNQLTVKDLVIDVKLREVRRSGIRISLRRKEFDILEYLVKNRGRAVSRDMILNHAWEAGKDNWNNTVDVHIKYLRDKIDRPFARPLIKTAYGIGYMVDDDS